MPLLFERNDICNMHVDAIVNPANETLLGGGGLDGRIHEAAGAELLEECRSLGGCRPGQAKITSAYKLPCRYIIHTVGPVWRGGTEGEREQLYSCYVNSLSLARHHGCESVAFPLISSGTNGCPMSEAISIAVDAISAFLLENDMRVYIVVFGREAMLLSSRLYEDIKEYIDDNYVDLSHRTYSRRLNRHVASEAKYLSAYFEEDERSLATPYASTEDCSVLAPMASSLEDAVRELDESFSQMLLRRIDEAGMTDAQCYKKANIDRRLFSKIRSDINYKPSKPTALAFAIALKMNMEDTKEFLEKAGYALSKSSIFDVIVRYFIEKENYNIFEINEALLAFDQSLLGG